MSVANSKYLLIILSAFVLFAGLPVIYTIGTFLLSEGDLSKTFASFDARMFPLLAKSGGVAFFVALFSTFFGTVFGFLLYKTKVPFKGFFKTALLIPLFLSPYILAVAWKDLIFALAGNAQIISSYAGVVLVLTFVYAPFSMLVVGGALANIDAQLEESGMMIAKFGSVALKIILPMIKPALASSFVLVFIFGISEFSVPAFLGVRVFTTEIFTQFSAFYNHSLAVLQSTLLIGISAILLLAEGKYISDAPFFSIGGKGAGNKIYDVKGIKFYGTFVLFAWFFLSVVFPFTLLIVQSFSDGSEMILRAFNLLLPTFGNSIALAFAGAFAIVVVGFSAAYFSSKSENGKLSQTFDWITLILFAIPSIILGVALIKFYNRPELNFIYSSWGIIVVAYAGKYSFISAKIIGNSIKQIPKSFDEAALLSGVSETSRIIKILLPLILPALFAAFVIGFIFSFGELGATIMLYPPGTEIMPIKVFTIMANAPQSLTSSMTLIVFSVTLALISIFYLTAKQLFKKFGKEID